MIDPKTASLFSIMLIRRAENLQALVQLPQPVASLATAWRASQARSWPCRDRPSPYSPHQPQPSFDVVAVLLQTGGEALDHATDHGAAVGFIHVLCRAIASSDSAGAGAAPADRARRLHQGRPRRIRRRLCQQARQIDAASPCGILFGGQPEEVARLDSSASARWRVRIRPSPRR